ncbi:hypothetical protein DL239_09715 [Sedimentitalea sp. CY04]|uniref:Uncharacterized protein n=1 Tax=Parasedimentitalea denitrificans TaxID=2211118 RepID=A0ABX0W993_9RHOB|nr:hypothetical protein [Sedimentitalea sp. CY04]
MFSTLEKKIGICADATGNSLPESMGPWHSYDLKKARFKSSRTQEHPKGTGDCDILEEILDSIDNQLFSELVNFLDKQDGIEILKYPQIP